jgi:hypothetical protein
VISPYDWQHLDEIMGGHGDWFTAQLLRLCAKADAMNLERIRVGFPWVVAAYEEWLSSPGE